MSVSRMARSRRDTSSRKTKSRISPVPSAEEPSDASTTRLSVYLRALARCEGEGQHVCSSQDLARQAGVKPALVRKDLTHFGQFGIRGVGYEVRSLRVHLTRILGLDRDNTVVILGAGNLGLALADSRGFNTGGFQTLALFDSDARKVGSRSRKGIQVRPMKELARYIRRHDVQVAVLAVPVEAAQRALDQAVKAGVRAVLNFAPVVLKVPEEVHVRSVDLKVHLEALSYRLTRDRLMLDGGGEPAPALEREIDDSH